MILRRVHRVFFFNSFLSKGKSLLGVCLLFAALAACSGMSGGGGGLQNAAAPTLDTGVAAPAYDPDGNTGLKGLYVKAQIKEVSKDEDQAAGNHVYQVTGTVYCSSMDGTMDYHLCKEGLTLKLVDVVSFAYVETTVKTDGTFQTQINNLMQALPDDEMCKFGLRYYINLREGYHSVAPEQMQKTSKLEDSVGEGFMPWYGQVVCKDRITLEVINAIGKQPPAVIPSDFGKTNVIPSNPGGGSSTEIDPGVIDGH